jgi:hypothetical protein
MEGEMGTINKRAVFLAVGLIAAGGLLLWAQTNAQKEEFTAFAVNTGLSFRGPQSTIVDITIDKWTTEAEKEQLLAAFKAKGQDGLLSVLENLPRVGTIRLPNSIGYDLHYASQEPAENGGRRIYLATNRYISYWEATTQPRSFTYPFTLIEMHLDKNNTGEGKMSVATRVTLSKDGKEIELENYGPIPVMLNEIKEVK